MGVLMSGGDDGVMEINKETWNAAGASGGGGAGAGEGEGTEVENKRNESPVASTAAGKNESIVRWERFLPKMMLRVLLVESDDSTRQIITALLRKCTYRVCAVSDGLKAWELLKGKAQNFDLILTEVDLPSISGFALLTLIMEHKICKNIPVIMMSSQDSVNTVYKCMLKGAADFLVKPVRKNELKNLWQHVWRRQASSSSGIGPPDESVAQQTLEATAENDGNSKCSSSDMVCIKRSREGVEKGSDDQSSCTKPESDVEGTKLDLPYSKRSKTSSTKGLQTNIGHNHLTKSVQDYHVGNEGSPVTTGIDSDRNIQQNTILDANKQACEDNHVHIHSTREAIDLIGAFDKHIECLNRNGNSFDGLNKSDSLSFLDLSLKRSLPYGLMDHVTEERRSLNHSDASAFSRYVNKTPCPGHSKSPTPCNQLGNPEAISDKHFFNHTVDINSNPSDPLIIPPRSTPLTSDQPSKTENRFPPTKLSLQNTSTYESLTPPAFYTNSSMPQLHSSPDSVSQQETSLQASFNPVNHRTGESLPSCNAASNNADDDDGNDQCENKDKKEGHVSSAAADQCENSGFCNGNLHNLQGTESSGKLESLSKHECGIDEALRVHVVDSLRSVQREAALMKFRLKRKDRCFEKKVRYESRKKLAEKRPRVKGQFVCQLSNQQLPPAKSSVVSSTTK